MKLLREQARRWVLRELDRQLQQRSAGVVTSKAKLTEHLEAAAAPRR